MTLSNRDTLEARTLGVMIQRLRQERKWTLDEFGRRTGLNPTYLGRLERGLNLPSLLTLLKIAPVLGTTASQMVEAIERKR